MAFKTKEEEKEYNKNYYLKHKKEIREKHKQYYKTPIGRATQLMCSYRFTDKRDNYSETVDFEPEWMVENIMNKPCAHCGKEGWNVIGCNRIDNTKGHTKDNVEPCCKECNDKLGLEYQWNK